MSASPSPTNLQSAAPSPTNDLPEQEAAEAAATPPPAEIVQEIVELKKVVELIGYKGPGLDYPRKYVQGQLKDAYVRQHYKSPVQEYDSTCRDIGAHPNSHVKELLTSNGIALMSSEVLGGESVSLRQTYVGERGFIALLPLLNSNTRWRVLDASNNGLRNEAVLHLVDMLLRPAHAGRRFHIDLSRNPISEGAGKALMELIKLHPGIESLNLSMTKIPRHLIERIKCQIERQRKTRNPDPHGTLQDATPRSVEVTDAPKAAGTDEAKAVGPDDKSAVAGEDALQDAAHQPSGEVDEPDTQDALEAEDSADKTLAENAEAGEAAEDADTAKERVD